MTGVHQYDGLIFDEFIGGSGTINNDFSYAFTNQPNNLIILTITNANGDQAIYQSQPLSIKENNLSETLLFPNPVKDILNIQSPGVQLKKIEVYDVQGKKVKSISNDFKKIDMQSFAPGIYFMKIYGDRRTSVEKIVKSP